MEWLPPRAHKSESLQSSRSGIVNSSMQLGWGGATSGRRDVPCLFDLLIRKGGGGKVSGVSLYSRRGSNSCFFFSFFGAFCTPIEALLIEDVEPFILLPVQHFFFCSRLVNRDKKALLFSLGRFVETWYFFSTANG